MLSWRAAVSSPSRALRSRSRLASPLDTRRNERTAPSRRSRSAGYGRGRGGGFQSARPSQERPTPPSADPLPRFPACWHRDPIWGQAIVWRLLLPLWRVYSQRASIEGGPLMMKLRHPASHSVLLPSHRQLFPMSATSGPSATCSAIEALSPDHDGRPGAGRNWHPTGLQGSDAAEASDGDLAPRNDPLARYDGASSAPRRMTDLWVTGETPTHRPLRWRGPLARGEPPPDQATPGNLRSSTPVLDAVSRTRIAPRYPRAWRRCRRRWPWPGPRGGRRRRTLRGGGFRPGCSRGGGSRPTRGRARGRCRRGS